MEQFIWAIIILIFIIFTALKNRARNRPETSPDRSENKEYKRREERDKISRYMEELLGFEIPESKPQIRAKRKKPESTEKVVKPRPEPVKDTKIGQFKSPLVKKYYGKTKTAHPGKMKICSTKLPWGTLSKKDLPRAIILSEIIGPPISKRKGHRLF